MTQRQPRYAGQPGDTDAVVNRVLDLEGDGALHDARRLAREVSRRDPAFAQRMASTRRVLSDLGELPRGPDLTDAILDRVEEERPFLPTPARRRVSIVRMAAAVGVLASLTAYIVLERVSPLAPPADPPVAGLAEAARADVASAARGLVHSFGSGRETAQVQRSPLTLGGTSTYEVGRPERPVLPAHEPPCLVVVTPTPHGFTVVAYSPAMRIIRADEIRSLSDLIERGEAAPAENEAVPHE